MKKIELLAPAGNLEKLKYAIAYGADAVYLGGNSFTMRALADNFSIEEMKKAVDFAHKNNKKVFLTLNITAKNDQISGIVDLAREAFAIGIDAFIISDIGVLKKIKKEISKARIHISTQANVTNYEAARMYYEMGANRIVLARELSLEEISQIRNQTEKDLELEIFIHGAMCISYSGRCLLSNYMTHRDSNQGNCAQACRWKYNLVEEKRPGEYYPVFEDDNGTYIFNSKDLALIKYVDALIRTGVDSFKIEGRMKSLFYVSSVVRIYREAINRYYIAPNEYSFDAKWTEELKKTSHREFTRGFIDGIPKNANTELHTTSSYIREYTYCGVIKNYDEEKKLLEIEQRNHFKVGDILEIVSPFSDLIICDIKEMYDHKMNSIEAAPHPQMKVFIPFTNGPLPAYSFIQKKVN